MISLSSSGGMKCPTCDSTQAIKNGHRKTVQSYRCKRCGRQFLEFYQQPHYSDETKQRCLELYFSGMGVKAIEQLTHIHHTTILYWIRKADLLSNLSLEPLLISQQVSIDNKL
jgi:transposase-like protein